MKEEGQSTINNQQSTTQPTTHKMKRNSHHAMQRPIHPLASLALRINARYGTGLPMLKGLAPLVAALALVAPQKAESAVIVSDISQFGSSAIVGYTLTNNDIGATYNSATLDLSAILGTVVDKIVLNNPNYDSAAEVYSSPNMTFNITSSGNVHSGWSSSLDTNTGMLSINHAPPPFGYTTWTSASNQNTMTGTLNLGNMLDFNGNGIIDANEQLYFNGLANNAFTAQEGVFFYNSDVDKIGVIPEPSSGLLVGLGLTALALSRRRREGRRVGRGGLEVGGRGRGISASQHFSFSAFSSHRGPN
jgi:hypothetical protein